MVAWIVLEQMITLFLIMMLGYLAAKLNILDGDTAKKLSTLLLKILLPVFVFGSMQIPYSSEGASIIAFAGIGLAVSMLISIVIAFIINKATKRERAENGLIMAACAFSNAIFLGKPVMESIYGQGISFQLSIITFFFNMIAFTLGLSLMTLGLTQKQKPGIIKRFLNPTIIAGFVGILFYFLSIRLPAPLTMGVDMVKGMLTPLSLIIIGQTLVGVNFKQIFLDWRIYIISFVRLIVSPILTYMLLRPFIEDNMTLGVMAVTAAMPVAATVGLMGEEYEHPHRLLSTKSIVVTTILSIATVPFVVFILGL